MAVLSVNVRVFYFGARGITFAELLLATMVPFLLVSTRARKRHCLVLLVWCWAFLVSGVSAIDVGEYCKSAGSFLLFTTWTFLIYEHVRTRPEARQAVLEGVILGGFVLACFAVIQSAVINLGGMFPPIVYPFGSLTWQTQKVQLLTTPWWRANSLYYEPNIFGMLATFAYFLSLHTGKRHSPIWHLLFLLGILSSLAATTYVILASGLFCYVMFHSPGRSFSRRSIFLRVVVGTMIVGMVTYGLFGATRSPLRRVSEISSPTSSGYYRVVVPAVVTLYVLSHQPFGIGLGNVDVFLKDAPRPIRPFLLKGLGPGAGRGTTLDNIVACLLVMLGILVLPIFLLAVGLIRTLLSHHAHAVALGAVCYCLGTGEFLSAHFTLIILAALLCVVRPALETPADVCAQACE